MANRTGVMLCYVYEPKRVEAWGFPYFVQPKINGNRCRAIVSASGVVTLYSSQGNEILGVPHVNNTLQVWSQIEPRLLGRELDGELYIHEVPHQQISGIIRSQTPKPESIKITYVIFDAISETMTQAERIQWLRGLLPPPFAAVSLLDTYTITSNTQLERVKSTVLSNGYEGVIFRKPDALYSRYKVNTILKWKPSYTMAGTITGRIEECDQYGVPKGTLGSFVCKDQKGRIFKVGTGFTAEQRYKFWQQTYVGQKILVKYFALSEDGVPVPGVFAGFTTE